MDEFQQSIVDHLKKELHSNTDIRALVWGGSLARGDGDEFSDLDFYIKVSDESSSAVFARIGEALSSLSELELNFHLRDNSGGFGRGVYRFHGRPFTETIEVTAHPVSDNFAYTKGVDDNITVLFDKDNLVKVQEIDQRRLVEERSADVPYLRDVYYAQKAAIIRQIKRESFLEAYMMYELFALKPLVKALLSKYAPPQRDYYLKDIYHNLPKTAADNIEPLYKISSIYDIENNLSAVEACFEDLVQRCDNTASSSSAPSQA